MTSAPRHPNRKRRRVQPAVVDDDDLAVAVRAWMRACEQYMLAHNGETLDPLDSAQLVALVGASARLAARTPESIARARRLVGDFCAQMTPGSDTLWRYREFCPLEAPVAGSHRVPHDDEPRFWQDECYYVSSTATAVKRPRTAMGRLAASLARPGGVQHGVLLMYRQRDVYDTVLHLLRASESLPAVARHFCVSGGRCYIELDAAAWSGPADAGRAFHAGCTSAPAHFLNGVHALLRAMEQYRLGVDLSGASIADEQAFRAALTTCVRTAADGSLVLTSLDWAHAASLTAQQMCVAFYEFVYGRRCTVDLPDTMTHDNPFVASDTDMVFRDVGSRVHFLCEGHLMFTLHPSLQPPHHEPAAGGADNVTVRRVYARTITDSVQDYAQWCAENYFVCEAEQRLPDAREPLSGDFVVNMGDGTLVMRADTRVFHYMVHQWRQWTQVSDPERGQPQFSYTLCIYPRGPRLAIVHLRTPVRNSAVISNSTPLWSRMTVFAALKRWVRCALQSIFSRTDHVGDTHCAFALHFSERSSSVFYNDETHSVSVGDGAPAFAPLHLYELLFSTAKSRARAWTDSTPVASVLGEEALWMQCLAPETPPTVARALRPPKRSEALWATGMLMLNALVSYGGGNGSFVSTQRYLAAVDEARGSRGRALIGLVPHATDKLLEVLGVLLHPEPAERMCVLLPARRRAVHVRNALGGLVTGWLPYGMGTKSASPDESATYVRCTPARWKQYASSQNTAYDVDLQTQATMLRDIDAQLSRRIENGVRVRVLVPIDYAAVDMLSVVAAQMFGDGERPQLCTARRALGVTFTRGGEPLECSGAGVTAQFWTLLGDAMVDAGYLERTDAGYLVPHCAHAAADECDRLHRAVGALLLKMAWDHAANTRVRLAPWVMAVLYAVSSSPGGEVTREAVWRALRGRLAFSFAQHDAAVAASTCHALVDEGVRARRAETADWFYDCCVEGREHALKWTLEGMLWTEQPFLHMRAMLSPDRACWLMGARLVRDVDAVTADALLSNISLSVRGAPWRSRPEICQQSAPHAASGCRLCLFTRYIRACSAEQLVALTLAVCSKPSLTPGKRIVLTGNSQSAEDVMPFAYTCVRTLALPDYSKISHAYLKRHKLQDAEKLFAHHMDLLCSTQTIELR